MYFSIICGALSDIFNYLVSILFFSFGSLSPPYFSTLAFQPGSAQKTPVVKTERNKGGKQHKQTKEEWRKEGWKKNTTWINFPKFPSPILLRNRHKFRLYVRFKTLTALSRLFCFSLPLNLNTPSSGEVLMFSITELNDWTVKNLTTYGASITTHHSTLHGADRIIRNVRAVMNTPPELELNAPRSTKHPRAHRRSHN